MATERPYPRFRSDLVIRRVVESGDAAWTVHDPLRNTFYRHDQLTHDASELLDGERGASAVLAALHERYPQYNFDEQWIDELVDSLRRGGFLEDTFRMNEIQRARAREARRKFAPTSLKNLLNIQFGVIDPTAAFKVIYPVARIAFTAPFILASVLAFFAACGLLWDRRDALVGGLSTIFTLSNSNWLGLLILWVILFLIVVAHEFGHGLCCKHFGGEPRRLGFLMFYLMPGMFCDVSDIYFFENRWHRAAVALAGGYVELLCFTAATFTWVATPPELLLHEVAYRVMLFSGVTGLIFNYNPLIKLDGYYVLMSWLDLPDLRERSFKYLSDLFRSRVLRSSVDMERLTRREKRAFLIYGGIAMVYSISYTWLMLLFVRGILVKNFRELGVLLFAFLFYSTTKKYWIRLWQGARFLALEKGGFVRRHVALSVALAVLAVAILLVPWPHRVTVTARLAPRAVGVVAAPYDGRVEEVLVGAGRIVRPGTVVAVVRPDMSDDPASEGDPPAVSRTRALEEARAEATDRQATIATHDPAAATRAPVARARAAQAAMLYTQGFLVSPLAGRVLTANVERLAGRRILAREPLIEIGALDSMTVLLEAGERDLADLAPGAWADLRLRAAPGRHERFRIELIDWAPGDAPVMAQPVAELVDSERPEARFMARGRIANPEGSLRPGMSGLARVDARPLNLLQRAGRLYSRLVRADFWL